MVMQYNAQWEWLLDAARMAFHNAGDIDTFKDADGLLCLRVPVMMTNGIVHETPVGWEAIPPEQIAQKSPKRGKKRT